MYKHLANAPAPPQTSALHPPVARGFPHHHHLRPPVARGFPVARSSYADTKAQHFANPLADLTPRHRPTAKFVVKRSNALNSLLGAIAILTKPRTSPRPKLNSHTRLVRPSAAPTQACFLGWCSMKDAPFCKASRTLFGRCNYRSPSAQHRSCTASLGARRAESGFAIPPAPAPESSNPCYPKTLN
jgi:hypothetical protein